MQGSRWVERVFPFLAWLRNYNSANLRADFIAGLTVALVLIPQSMAYAQLAGLPVYYGLYAAFLPPMIAGLFGSSRQLATGPVAVVSLMTAAGLEPLATAGSPGFISYAIFLALLVGIFQFALGVLRLGIIVNFLSHPVVNGFTNAAALIIATSQLSKLFGVYVDNAEYHYETVYRVVKSAVNYTHWPSFGLAVLAFLIMIILKRVNPRIPNVLVAVVITTLISWATGFEQTRTVDLSMMQSPKVRRSIEQFNAANKHIAESASARADLSPTIREAERKYGAHSPNVIELRHQVSMLNIEIEEQKEQAARLRAELRSFLFESTVDSNGNAAFFRFGETPSEQQGDGTVWRLKVGNRALDESALLFLSGGSVVGKVPSGLPKLALPRIDLSVFSQIFSIAVIISLLGFMEAISIAKAMAAKTGQRLDPNQELIGQGLANIFGSFGQSYPASGSFSRSAVNIQAGAGSGMSSVFTSCLVVIVLLFFTPLLYHLPESVLAAIIMMAVVGLVNVGGIVRAWRAQKYDGMVAIVSFVFTLAFAPHLDKGIIIGVLLSLGISLFRHMRPDIAMLSKHPDGSFRNSVRWGLKQCRYIAVIRFNGSLFFATTNYLEDQILDRVAAMNELKHILIVGNAINELDASGEEMLSSLIDKVQHGGYEISFSGLNDAIIDVMKRTHLYERIGEDHMFRNVYTALQAIHAKAHKNSQEKVCPLLAPCYEENEEETAL
ncbi:MAG: SulP family inorganic anion transporter [bacterium]